MGVLMWFLIRSVFLILICVASLVLGNVYTNYQVLFMISSVVSFGAFALSLAHEFTIDL